MENRLPRVTMVCCALWAATVLACGVAVYANGALPQYAFVDRETALCVGAGRASLSLALDGQKWAAVVRRGVGSRVEVALRTSESRPFDLCGKLMVVRNLLPVTVTILASGDGLMLLSTWLLGPVHVDVGRLWGGSPSRWGVITISPASWISVLAGIETGASRGMVPVLGLRLYPGRSRLWGLSAILGSTGIRLTVGGTL